jgi:hypothetical protein
VAATVATSASARNNRRTRPKEKATMPAAIVVDAIDGKRAARSLPARTFPSANA